MERHIRKSPTPPDWHAHIYFDATTRCQALALRESLRESVVTLGLSGVCLGNLNEGPRGPHTVPSYEVHIPERHLVVLKAWFNANRGPLSVLLHPLTPDEVGDHSCRALWLGVQKPLAFEAFSR